MQVLGVLILRLHFFECAIERLATSGTACPKITYENALSVGKKKN